MISQPPQASAKIYTFPTAAERASSRFAAELRAVRRAPNASSSVVIDSWYHDAAVVDDRNRKA